MAFGGEGGRVGQTRGPVLSRSKRKFVSWGSHLEGNEVSDILRANTFYQSLRHKLD